MGCGLCSLISKGRVLVVSKRSGPALFLVNEYSISFFGCTAGCGLSAWSVKGRCGLTTN